MRLIPCVVLGLLAWSSVLKAEDTPDARRVYIVDQNAAIAGAVQDGSPAHPFKTISQAAEIAQPGDTVLVHAGVYRERVAPARGGTSSLPITYQAAPGQRVIVKGSNLFTPDWRADPDHPGVFRGDLDPTWFKDQPNPYLTTISVASHDQSIAARPTDQQRMPITLGQVFVDESPMTQVQTLQDVQQHTGTWIVSADGRSIILHLPRGMDRPDDHQVEIAVRNRVFAPHRRGLHDIHVIGFTFMHCANQGPFPQGGMVSTHSGRDWVIVHNTIRFAKTIGLDCGSETWKPDDLTDTDPEDRKQIFGGGHLIVDNVISDNGLSGISGWNCPGVRIADNLLERNNRLGFSRRTARWEEWAAIKLHATDAVIEGNIIRDNDAHGIWIDNDYKIAHITRNLLVNNQQAGIFLELGDSHALIDDNIIAYTRSQGGFWPGHGIYAHDASGLVIAHNLLLANAGSGVCLRAVSGRKFRGELVEASDNTIVNNVFIDNARGAIDLPYPNARGKDNQSDFNLLLSGAEEGRGEPRFMLNRYQGTFSWKDVYERLGRKDDAAGPLAVPPHLTLEQWRSLMQLDQHSVQESARCGALLRSRDLSLSIDMPASAWTMKCPPAEDAERDFLGNPIPQTDILPGPFQRLSQGRNELMVDPPYFEPAIRLRPDQKERRNRTAAMDQQVADMHKPEQEHVVSTDVLVHDGRWAEPVTSAWFFGSQAENDPELFDAYELRPITKATSLWTRSKKGVSHSSSQCVLYQAPGDGWYHFTIDAKLIDRTAASAGYVVVKFYQLDGAQHNARLLDQLRLNSPGGYPGGKYPDVLSRTFTVACRAGWYTAVSLQVCAPGPAPAGDAKLQFRNFTVEKLDR